MPSACAPDVDVIVPVQDEAVLIARKIKNLQQLRYDGRLRVWIVDGRSTDGTDVQIEELARGDARLTLLRAGEADKTAQLNFALRRSSAEWVMITDADAELAPDTLSHMLAMAGEAAAVGTTVRPAHAHPIEDLHWRALNALCRWESHLGTSAMVTAPCYLFRRVLLADGFPADVIADDMYVALKALRAGRRVAFVDRNVRELRSPGALGTLFRHKMRKAHAYVRELSRCVAGWRQLPPRARGLVALRVAHLAAASLVLPVLFAGAALVLSAWGAAAAATLLGALVLAVAAGGRSVTCAAGLLLLLGVVLPTTLVLYPFSRDTAALARIVAGARAGEEDLT